LTAETIVNLLAPGFIMMAVTTTSRLPSGSHHIYIIVSVAITVVQSSKIMMPMMKFVVVTSTSAFIAWPVVFTPSMLLTTEIDINYAFT
jgi:hypothetical protein